MSGQLLIKTTTISKPFNGLILFANSTSVLFVISACRPTYIKKFQTIVAILTTQFCDESFQNLVSKGKENIFERKRKLNYERSVS